MGNRCILCGSISEGEICSKCKDKPNSNTHCNDGQLHDFNVEFVNYKEVQEGQISEVKYKQVRCKRPFCSFDRKLDFSRIRI